MRLTPTFLRSAVAATLLVGLLGGCHWFKKDSELYKDEVAARPLEVPPDLDKPAIDAAMKMPPTASAAAPSAPVAGAGATPLGFTVPVSAMRCSPRSATRSAASPA